MSHPTVWLYRLTTLDLSTVALGDDCAVVLAESLVHNQHLSSLLLEDCEIGEVRTRTFLVPS